MKIHRIGRLLFVAAASLALSVGCARDNKETAEACGDVDISKATTASAQEVKQLFQGDQSNLLFCADQGEGKLVSSQWAIQPSDTMCESQIDDLASTYADGTDKSCLTAEGTFYVLAKDSDTLYSMHLVKECGFTDIGCE